MQRQLHLDRHVQGSAVHDGFGAEGSDGRARDELRDELAADELRRRLRTWGFVPIEPDDRIRALLVRGECVLAVRRAVSLERRTGPRAGDEGLGADLYLTSRRLVILGHEPVEYPLAQIREIYVSAGAVRLVVEGNRGVELRVPDPRVLRVAIAAAREAIRAASSLDVANAERGGQDSLR